MFITSDRSSCIKVQCAFYDVFPAFNMPKKVILIMLVLRILLQLINEAMELREKNRQRNVFPEPPAIIPAKHLALYT